MINDDYSDWWRSEAADEDARFQYIEGQNDALALDNPASTDYYYLCGWHDTKAQLAEGKLCFLARINQAQEPTDDWWNDWRKF